MQFRVPRRSSFGCLAVGIAVGDFLQFETRVVVGCAEASRHLFSFEWSVLTLKKWYLRTPALTVPPPNKRSCTSLRNHWTSLVSSSGSACKRQVVIIITRSIKISSPGLSWLPKFLFSAGRRIQVLLFLFAGAIYRWIDYNQCSNGRSTILMRKIMMVKLLSWLGRGRW